MNNYSLFLFDFDGLLVNTEELHFRAYKEMMKARGIELTWDFSHYCQSAHYTSDKLREDLMNDFPELGKLNVPWSTLYKEKQERIHSLLVSSPPGLMKGAADLLGYLQTHSIPHCVVTHSPDTLVELVKQRHEVLRKIPHWITRHDYTKPKPDPECYELAIRNFAKGGKAIGFEDSPRGLAALRQTTAEPVLITRIPYPELEELGREGVSIFPSLLKFMHTLLSQG